MLSDVLNGPAAMMTLKPSTASTHLKHSPLTVALLFQNTTYKVTTKGQKYPLKITNLTKIVKKGVHYK